MLWNLGVGLAERIHIGPLSPDAFHSPERFLPQRVGTNCDVAKDVRIYGVVSSSFVGLKKELHAALALSSHTRPL